MPARRPRRPDLRLPRRHTKRAIVGRAFSAAGWQHSQTLVWIKDHFALGRHDYHWRHEPILYGWKPAPHSGHPWHGERTQDTVIEGATRSALEALEKDELVEVAWRLLQAIPGTTIAARRPRVAELHPTSKPIDLIARHLRNSSDPDDIVADPFAGSGSTLIAGEQTRRPTRLIELSPAYCDVIINRWQDLTGNKAKRPAARRRRAGKETR